MWLGQSARFVRAVKATDKYGNKPLHYAAREGHVAAITLLIKRGAPVNARTLEGDSALHLASGNGHAKAVQELLASGAAQSVDNDGKTPEQHAREWGYEKVSKLLANASKSGKAKSSRK